MKLRYTLPGISLLAVGLGLWLWISTENAPSRPPRSEFVVVPEPVPQPIRPRLFATRGGANAPDGHNNRRVIASVWRTGGAVPGSEALSTFTAWAQRYQNATDENARQALMAEGLSLAQARREVMVELIRQNPEQALANAVPMAVRQHLPAEVLALLEDRVSGQATLSLLAATPAPGETVTESQYRSALIDGTEFRAYTYGRRSQMGTLLNASITGVAIDGQLAVSDSPVRLVEPGEQVDPTRLGPKIVLPGHEGPSALPETPGIYVEAMGTVRLVCCPEHLTNYEEQLITAEQSRYETPTAGNNLPGTSGVAGRPSLAWTHGTKKVLVIRVDFPDRTGTPINYTNSTAITEDVVVNGFNTANGFRDFYEQGSYGNTTLEVAPAVAGDSPDVTAVLRLASTAVSYATSGNNELLHSDARAAATTAGFNVAAYDRVAVVFSRLSDIPSSQITYGGLGDVIGTRLWINGAYTLAVVTHEIGHNYGLNHANLWQVSDGNPVSLAGTSTDYGDPFDIMGSSSVFAGHFSMWNKSILQWLPDAAVPTISTGGTYRVYRFDHASANPASSLALKIVRDRTRDYWIGYRRATANASLNNGAYVQWGYYTNAKGNLLDLTTPGTASSDAALAVGATLNDSAAGITLTTVAKGGTGGADEWLDMQVTFQPRIQWSQATYIGDEQVGSVALKLTRSSNSVGSVSVNYATVPGVATSPADYTAASGTVTWANGDTADKTISITLVPDAVVEGTENFAVNLSGVSGGVIVDNTSATVTIADPGARDTTFASVPFLNSTVEDVLPQPDGSTLLSGWFSTVQVPPTFAPIYSRGGITRILSDGSWDDQFASAGGATGGTNPRIMEMARQADGRVVVGGTFTAMNGTAKNNLARLLADGSVDTTFIIGTGPNAIVSAVLVQPDGKILIGGAFTSYNAVAREYVARLNSDGSLDTSFVGPDFNGTSGWSVESLALQPDGKILVGGVFPFTGSPSKAGLCRLTTAGALDSAFNGVTSGAHVLGNTGSLQRVYRIEVLPDEKILIAGQFTAFNGVARGGLARLSSTGALDTTFAPTSDGTVYALLPQPDGKILVGGSFTTFQGISVGRLARLDSSSALDTAYVAAGGAGGEVHDLALLPDSKVIFGGGVSNFQGTDPLDPRPVWRFFGGLPGLPGTIQWSSDTLLRAEGASAALTATRTGGSLGPVTVGYATTVGTAGTSDFTTAQGILTWANGDTAPKQVTVSLTADSLAESVENFTVQLGQPLLQNSLLGALQQTTVQIDTAFGVWTSTYFTALEEADANISGDNADPDGDGLVNLLEFALGLNPRVVSASGRPASAIQNLSGQNYLTLTFRRRVPTLDLTYVPQTNDTLPGTWLSNAVLVGSPVNNGDGTETVTYRDNTPMSAAILRRFMKLQVTRTP